ncbi:hypothetical protein Tco_1209393 [Tanacetum coccineum]
MLKVTPRKGTFRFGKIESLIHDTLDHSKFLNELAPVAYKLELPKELNSIHNTFPRSNLKKLLILSDESKSLSNKRTATEDKLNFVEEPVEVMDREIKQLKRSLIMESLVKKKQKGAILELKRRHLKNTIFCTYTPYPAMKIRRISASSAQETRNDQFPIRRIHYNQYAVCTAVHHFALRNFNLEDMELESTNSGPNAKLPTLKLGSEEHQESKEDTEKKTRLGERVSSEKLRTTPKKQGKTMKTLQQRQRCSLAPINESKTKPEKKTVIPTAAKIEKPVKKSVRVDNDYYAKTSHHRTHKNMTPRAVLQRTGLKPLSTAKSVYTAHPKPTVHCINPPIYDTQRNTTIGMLLHNTYTRVPVNVK